MKDRALILWISGGVFGLLATIGGFQIKILNEIGTIKIKQAVIVDRMATDDLREIKDTKEISELRKEFNSHLLEVAQNANK